MIFAYSRVSNPSQKIDLQIDSFLKEGIEPKNINPDVTSGAKEDRKGLKILRDKLREGDTVVVWKMDRIARSLSHLVNLLEDFEKKGIHFKSIQESFLDTSTTYGKFIFTQFAAFAQLERDLLIERTKAGRNNIRRRGYKARTKAQAQ